MHLIFFFFPDTSNWAQCQLEGISVKCPFPSLKFQMHESIATFQREDHQHEVGIVCEKLRQKVSSISCWTLNSMFGSSGCWVGKCTMLNTGAAKFGDLSSLNHFCKLWFIRDHKQRQTVDRSLKHVPHKLGQTVTALIPKTFCLNFQTCIISDFFAVVSWITDLDSIICKKRKFSVLALQP